MTHYEALTTQENNILRLIALGCSSADVAAQLVVAPETVKWYLRQIYSKLDVHNRVQAVLRACEIGLVKQHELTGPGTLSVHDMPRRDQGAMDTFERSRASLLPWSTTIVGRTRELQDLGRLLQDGSARIITLHGPGGIGKTRLALELAWQHRDHYQLGVCWVSLAEIQHPEALPDAILAELALRIPPRLASLDQALQFLQDKSLLLVLDNFEHLSAGAGLLSQIAGHAPRVRLLATSREALHLSDEQLYRLDGMAMDPLTDGDVSQCSAVQLFVQAASRFMPHWTPAPHELATLLRICRVVNGSPLAILLAARWLHALSLDDIESELARSLDLLASDLTDLPPRQRNMRAVLDATWARMSHLEREVFMRLSVFRGGFTFDAARAVAGATPQVMGALIDKALVTRHGQNRYGMHDLLARYAHEHLSETPAALETARRQHTEYFARFVADRVPGMKGHRQVQTLEEVAADFENVQAAWGAAVDQADAQRLEWMQDGVGIFCHLTRRFHDDERLLADALTNPPDSVILRARLACRYQLRQRRPDPARMAEPVAILQQSGHPADVAFGLFSLGVIESLAGHIPEAEGHFQDGLARFRQIRDSYYEARTLLELACCADVQRQFDVAYAWRQAAIDVAHEAEDVFCQFLGLNDTGLGLLRQGEFARSAVYYREAQHLARAIGSPAREAWCMLNRGLIAFFMGNLPSVQAFASLAQQRLQGTCDTYKAAYALYLHGLHHFAHRQYDEANETLLQALAMDQGVRPDVHWVWSLTACEQQQMATARAHVQEAIRGWLPSHSPAFILWALPVAVVVLTHERRLHEAVQMAALCATHPAAPRSWLETWPPFQKALQTLRAELAPDVYQIAWAQGCGQEPLHVATQFTA